MDTMKGENMSCITYKVSCMHCVDTSPKIVYRGIEPRPARNGGSNWKISRFPMILVPAYSLLKQEQLQLAQLVFVIFTQKLQFDNDFVRDFPQKRIFSCKRSREKMHFEILTTKFLCEDSLKN